MRCVSGIHQLEARSADLARQALAEPGDTVYLRAGTYRETVVPAHSGTAAAPITYAAYGNEVVTIDGADLLSGWTNRKTSSFFVESTTKWWMTNVKHIR